MKKFVQEFKTFALRGNVMDMAIGVIIGGAFSSIVTSFTENLISPIIGMLGGANLDQYSVTLLGATFKYGAFLTTVVNFIIMAFVLFCMIKVVNRMTMLGKKSEPAAAPTTKTCPYCLSEINIKATRCPHCTSEQPTE